MHNATPHRGQSLDASQLMFSANDGTDWTTGPTEVDAALDELAQRITDDAGGDVVGPSSSTDNAVVRWNGTTGKVVQDSGVTLSDTDHVSGFASVGVDSGGVIGLSTDHIRFEVNQATITIGNTSALTIHSVNGADFQAHDITTTGDITGTDITATGDIAGTDIDATGDLTVAGDIVGLAPKETHVDLFASAAEYAF